MNLPPFEAIAKPHRDIQKGVFTADVYAAKLGQVAKNEGTQEYRNADEFFERTYMTEGLKGLLSGVEGRLTGRERQRQDPIVQLQTPFGGGKTHTLIALYHKAREWGAQPVVWVGSELDPTDTFWGQIEEQLTGNRERFTEKVAPGSEGLAVLFAQTGKPVLILMDEMLQYLTRAAGVRVQRSNLAAQTVAFILSLTEAVAQSDRVALVVTLQESEIEPIAKQFPLFNGLLDRMQRRVTPVADGEIASIIRSRLFTGDGFNEGEAKRVAREFARYAKKNNILPEGVQESEYRSRFVASYPFLPEVVDVLYERWGSFPDFQRTRGVLQILSRVVHRASGKKRPYITLADFDLNDTDIRSELLKHIDDPYQSVIASDIAGANPYAEQADRALGETFKGMALGTRTATAIFLYSFAGGMQRGATSAEIKRNVVSLDHPASAVDSAMNQLAAHLFYLRPENGVFYFDTQPNLNRIIHTRMENVDAAAVEKRAKAQLDKHFRSRAGSRFSVTVLPKANTDIPENDGLKLIVLDKRDDAFCRELVETRGEIPRISRNTLFFLMPGSDGATELATEIRKTLAYEAVKNDNSLNLSDAQKREVAAELRKSNEALDAALRKDYRYVLVPGREGFSEEYLGIPAAGMNAPLDEQVYELLRSRSVILETIGPKNILIRYLNDHKVLGTLQLLHSSLRTPGETRVLREAWIAGIRKGVADGMFALGERRGGTLIPRAFREASVAVTLEENEVIIHPDLIRERLTPADILHDYLKDTDSVPTDQPFQSQGAPIPLYGAWELAIREGVQSGMFGLGDKIGDTHVPRAFRQELSRLTLSSNEVLLQPGLCTSLIADPPPVTPPAPSRGPSGDVTPDPAPVTPPDVTPQPRKSVSLRFRVPDGKVSNVGQCMRDLQASFPDIQLHLTAAGGEMSEEAYAEFKEKLEALGGQVEEV